MDFNSDALLMQIKEIATGRFRRDCLEKHISPCISVCEDQGWTHGGDVTSHREETPSTSQLQPLEPQINPHLVHSTKVASLQKAGVAF